MDNIKNMNVLITGAASGIGLFYAEYMLKNGAKAVAILDLPTSAGSASAANLEKAFGKGKARFYPCDVTNVAQFEEVFKQAARNMNVIDIVINNAGILNDKNWQLTMNVNIGGVTQGSLLAIEHMHKSRGGKGGTLVNIASIVALDIYDLWPVYCASKHQVLAFSRCIEKWYDETGVRVLVICPGVTASNLFDDMNKTTLEFSRRQSAKELLASIPSQGPENVAEAMVTIIQKGKNGSVWVSEAGNPPYAVEFPPLKKVELNF